MQSLHVVLVPASNSSMPIGVIVSLNFCISVSALLYTGDLSRAYLIIAGLRFSLQGPSTGYGKIMNRWMENYCGSD